MAYIKSLPAPPGIREPRRLPEALASPGYISASYMRAERWSQKALAMCDIA